MGVGFGPQDDLKMQPAKVGVWQALGGSPWVVKPLWGFLSGAHTFVTARLGAHCRTLHLVSLGPA